MNNSNYNDNICNINNINSINNCKDLNDLYKNSKIDIDVDKNYCISFNKDGYNNPLFKLILIEEVKRFSDHEIIPVKDFYNRISILELRLQFICTDATLSRGTLALAENNMIKNCLDKDEIKKKIRFLSKNYIYYYYAKEIYESIIRNVNLDTISDSTDYFWTIRDFIINTIKY